MLTCVCPRKFVLRKDSSGNDTIDLISHSIFDLEFSERSRFAVVYAAGDAINRAILP